MCPHTYLMTSSLLKRLETRNGPQICQVCGKPIEEAQKVLSKNGPRHTKIYHKKFYESLFLDI